MKSRLEHYCDLVSSRLSWASETEKTRKAKDKTSLGVSLSKTQIEEARALAAEGWTNKRISVHFGAGMAEINKVCKGVKRGHADGR